MPAEPVVPEARSFSSRWLTMLPLVTLIVGVAATAALVLVSAAQYTRNENRLLGLRVRDAAVVLSGALASIQTPLTSTAELADATGANPAKFRRFVAPYAGAPPTHQFVSMSLWRSSDLAAGPVVVAGMAPEIGTAQAQAFLAHAERSPRLSVLGLVHASDARLGYALSTPGVKGGYIAYAEQRLPASRHSRLQNNSSFVGLDYAIYLGRSQRPADLLVSNKPRLAATERHRATTVPFGDTYLTLVMGTPGPLAGTLPQRLPWIIGVLGLILSLAAAHATRRLNKRRRDAERLARRLEVSASENRRLYAEQRGIAQTLQHALLPERLPHPGGLETGGRYEAGEQGVEIGGDWYDLIELDEDRVLLVVGDVSGRGLRAATTMAALRYAIRAYAAQSDPPETILTKLTHLISVAEDGQMATVLCALVDARQMEITLTSAGHLPPLLLSDGHGSFIDGEVGLPIGVEAGTEYQSTTVTVAPGSTLVAYTDGLVEVRGESIDEGLERLRRAAEGERGPVSDMLGRLVSELTGGPAEDDIAIVGVRWTS